MPVWLHLALKMLETDAKCQYSKFGMCVPFCSSTKVYNVPSSYETCSHAFLNLKLPVRFRRAIKWMNRTRNKMFQILEFAFHFWVPWELEVFCPTMALITTQTCLQKRLLCLYIICLNIWKFEKTSKIAGLERHVPFTERSEKKIEILNI